jgi:O-antigen ligase
MFSLNKLGIPIFFLPLFLISGPFIPDLILTISVIIFLIFIIINKRFHYFKNKYFIFFFCFWIFISINSLLSENIISIKSSFTYLRFGIFFVLLVYLFNLNENLFENFKKVILFSILILFVDSLIQYFVGYNILGLPKSGRLSSFFGEEKIMGSFIVKLLPLYIALYFFKKKKVKLDFHIFLILLISVCLVLLSRERSALGLFILYLSLSSLIFFNKKRELMIFFCVIISFFVLIFSINKGLYDRFILQLINDAKIIVENNNTQKNSSEISKKDRFYIFTKAHDQMIRTSYKMFLDKPVIGHGTKMYRFKCSEKKYSEKPLKYSCNTHPHNYYFQMLSENGIIGFIFLIITFFYFLINFFKNIFSKNKNKVLNLLILPNIINLWPIIPHGNFFNNWISITIFLSIGFFICYTQRELIKKD